MKTIGISVYPDFDDKELIKEQLDTASELGYQVVFTSMQLGDLGFENTKVGINDNFIFLFDYCDQLGLEIHVDINARMLKHIKATPNDLKPIADLKIRVLRLDGGFTNEEAAMMTNNPYGIIIEENASMLQFPKKRIETIVNKGNVNQYYACHNYFPLNETGLSYQDALKATRLFKQYNIKVGIFIGSLSSSKELNAIGRGIITIERHRYLPSHIQAMELFVHQEYDYVIFGDSHPSYDELKRVSDVAQNDSLDKLKKNYDLDNLEMDLSDIYCVELPVWLNKSLNQELKEKLIKKVYLARADQPEDLLRATQSRGIDQIKINLPITRNAYAITLNNELANRYMGELQIPLIDLPAVEYTNVIGQVIPYGQYLVELLKYGKVAFILKEE